MRLFFVLLFVAPAIYAESRLDLHNKARVEFFNTHFFENGRGATLTPNLSLFMNGVNRSQGNRRGSILDKTIARRYGFIYTPEKKYMGVFAEKYKGMEVGVLGCTACHSGKAAGIIIAGLGNKTIDVRKIGNDLLKIQKVLKPFRNSSEDFRYIYDKSLNFAQVISDQAIGNLTRGLVPDSVIKTFFYKDRGLPYPKDMPRLQVKAPHLWGFKEKRPAGIFYDGIANGETYAWMFGAELFASDSSEHLRVIMPKLIHMADNVLGNLLPPKYPFKIDEHRANKGRSLVVKNCFGCHGDHDRDINGLPLYTAPKVIPLHKIQTDSERMLGFDTKLEKLVDEGSLKDLLFFNKENIGKGYFAPKLWGIWSRFPYMHNASIPSLYQIFLKPSERDEIFYMQDAGEEYRFDKSYVGLKSYDKKDYKKALRKAKKGNRDIYYTKRMGQSNQGHYFGFMDNLSHDNRMDMIEFLKTL
jgi:hypothetical protein